MLNGKPATFLIDTGAPFSLVRGDRAAYFNLEPLGRVEASTGRTFPLAAARELRIGDVNLGAATLALYRDAQFGGPVPGIAGMAADGLLGLDILRRQKAVINCHTRKLWLASAGTSPTSAAAFARAAGLMKVPMDRNRAGQATVPCSIRGRPGTLIVDTGAFVTSIDDDIARMLGLESQESAITTRGIGGRVQRLKLVRVDDLKIGALRIPAQPFAVFDLFGKKKPVRAFTGLGRLEFYPARDKSGRSTRFGLLGNELLDQHYGIIDLGTDALFVK